MRIHIIIIDNNGEWQEALKAKTKNIEFYCFELRNNNTFGLNKMNFWYNIPEDHLISSCTFDIVIVDASYGKKCDLSHYVFVPFLKGRFNIKSVIYVDDTNRKDELEIVNLIRPVLGH